MILLQNYSKFIYYYQLTWEVKNAFLIHLYMMSSVMLAIKHNKQPNFKSTVRVFVGVKTRRGTGFSMQYNILFPIR